MLLRYDTVDFCEKKNVNVNAVKCNITLPWRFTVGCTLHQTLPSLFLPVRMFLKASSTLVESKAEVSMNERVFFSEDEETKYDVNK